MTNLVRRSRRRTGDRWSVELGPGRYLPPRFGGGPFGMTFGETSTMTTVVYGLVGAAGLYQALTWKSIQRRCQGLAVAHNKQAGTSSQAVRK
jgi:hypothetical protein